MEGDDSLDVSISGKVISIHSLRMEGDKFGEKIGECVDISIHSLRMEGDAPTTTRKTAYCTFQSTPSAWRETKNQVIVLFPVIISIHSLRMEGDLRGTLLRTIDLPFQSTPSAWRETLCAVLLSTLRINFNPLPPHGGRPIHH